MLTPAQSKDTADGKLRLLTIEGIPFKVYIHPPVKKSKTVQRKKVEKDKAGKVIKEWVEDVEETWIAGNFVELIPLDRRVRNVAYSDMSEHCATYREECRAFQEAVTAAKQVAVKLKMRTDYTS